MPFHYLQDLLFVILGTGIAAFCLLSWGQLTLRLLSSANGQIQINHAWIGLATLASFASFLQLFIPIQWGMSLTFILTALVNACTYEKASWLRLLTSIKKYVFNHPVASIASLLGVFFLSSGALLAPGNYDSGLYHFTTIAWLNQHPITLGLGNLHGRLAFNQSYFPLVALLNIHPFWNKGYSIAGPLFIYLGFAGIAFGGLNKMRFGIILQAILFVLLASLCTDISAPTPDLAISVLQIVIFAQLIKLLWQVNQAVEPSTAALIAFACLCFLICNIKLSGAAFGLSALLVLVPTYWIYCKNYTTSFLKLQLLLVTYLLTQITRSYFLSGTPFYPITWGALSWVDWAVPIQTMQAELDWAYSWARRPGYPMTEVLGNWHWLRPWLGTLSKVTLLCFFLSSIGLPWSLYLDWRLKKSFQTKQVAEQYIVKLKLAFIPLVIATLYWFFTAPDIRFLGVIHQLLAIFSVWFILAILNPRWMAPISAICMSWYGFSCAMIIVISLQIIRPGLFTGIQQLPISELKTNRTASDLIIYSPVSGEQCGNATLPCTPYFNSALQESHLYHWWLIYSVQ